MEARKRSIPVLEKHLEERNQRVETIGADLKKLNARIETEIDGLIKKLSGVKDSEESNQRISLVKIRAMKGLGKSARRYQTKRNDLLREIREGRSEIPNEILERDAKVFDEHIAKRVSQILELSKSFTQEEDVEKYEKVDGGSYYSPGLGWNDDIEQISEEWRQNRRDRVMDHKQQREVLEALEKSIEREQNYVKSFVARLKNKQLGNVDRRLMEAELNRHKALLQTRLDQFAEMSEVAKPNTNAVSQEDAQDLEHSLNDAAEDLRRDIDRLFFEYAGLNRERGKAASIAKNLEARKKWLKEHAGE